MLEVVYVDLDGTLLDFSRRHYACYMDCVVHLGGHGVPFAAYWQMKRNRASIEQLLKRSAMNAAPNLYSAEFETRIEAPEFLTLDSPYPDAGSALTDLRVLTDRVYLVTMRRNLQALDAQLRAMGMAAAFDSVIARGSSTTESKAALIRHCHAAPNGPAAWIGDTEEDIAAARSLGSTACAVSSGIRDRRLLEAANPDIVADSLREAIEFLSK